MNVPLRASRVPALTLFTLLLLAGPVHAVDGVREISQTCALSGGCFPGDKGGFPVTIQSAGSYRLTSSLDLRGQPGPENVTAIDVDASQVTIDLNGFEIVGATQCSGTPTSCSPTGAGTGIDAFPLRDHVTVKNGVVRGMGDDGIRISNFARITDVFLQSNGGDGLQVSSHSVVTGNVVHANGGVGISAGSSVVLRGNSVSNSGSDGISASFGSTISNNTVLRSADDGIQTGGDSTVTGNASRLNTGFGLRLGSSGYVNNVVNSNTGGTVSGGIELGPNLCDVSTSCP